MQTDSRRVKDAEQAAAGRVAEIQARTAAAKDLALVDRAAAREMARVTITSSPPPAAPVPVWSQIGLAGRGATGGVY
jgi:hypothetical protein